MKNDLFHQAKWIWPNASAGKDEYSEFFLPFTYDGKGKVICRISCDGDYTLFINGQYVASNQYGDFEYYKIYDELDVTSFVKAGENKMAVLVWHFGEDTMRYYPYQAGLLLEVNSQDKTLAFTDENTLSRMSKAYKNGNQQWMTPQFGFSFFYDATKEDDWICTGNGCAPSIVVNKQVTLFPRPVEKGILYPTKKGEKTQKDGGRCWLIDLGEETVGLPTLSFVSPIEQEILVSFGEDTKDGHVRRIVDNRDFSFTYVAKQGINEYTNYMMRLGCRYLELQSAQPIELNFAGIIPQKYPVKRVQASFGDELTDRIYALCVNTLELCMMEHYVDCPWREQCLYAFDSRNQMLCGYYAFEGGNAAYARANLLLMGKDRREDELLSICFPSKLDLTIPSFSLYYFIAVWEYVEHTGDTTLVKQLMPKLRSIMQAFVNNRENGLVKRFLGENHWAFYDWSEELGGENLPDEQKCLPDLMLNALFIMALEKMRLLCEKVGEPFEYAEVIAQTRTRAKQTFYRANDGLFVQTEDSGKYLELPNAVAILAGLTDEKESECICDKLAKGELSPCSLSMKTLKYDALLCVDEEKYKQSVLDEIACTYKKMLDAGATATWETIEGAAAFANAGSLCHGWSAIPVYYYHKLLK